MRIVSLSAAALALAACGAESGPRATLYVEPPQDDSCIGVVGFDVTISPAGHEAVTRRLRRSAPVLEVENCQLPDSLFLEDLNPDAPITVTVAGYDATGASARVSGRTDIPGLRGDPARLSLEKTAPTLPTVLVIYRNRLLDNVPWSTVKTMTIATQMGSKTLLTVDRDIAKEFFDLEPGAFGIPTLEPGGKATTSALIVTFTTTDTTTKNARITVGDWMGTYYMAN
jgi:hypothetical protein